MPEDTAFSRWLKEEMPRRGYPIDGPRAGGKTRLADESGVSRASLSRIIDGLAAPSLDTLRKIGGVFGIGLGEMLVHADMAKPAEVGSAPTGPQHKGLDDFLPGLEDLIRAHEGEPEPPEPPGGFLADYERDIWASAWRVPWGRRYAAILAIRAVDDPARTIAHLRSLIRTEGPSPTNDQSAAG